MGAEMKSFYFCDLIKFVADGMRRLEIIGEEVAWTSSTLHSMDRFKFLRSEGLIRAPSILLEGGFGTMVLETVFPSPPFFWFVVLRGGGGSDSTCWKWGQDVAEVLGRFLRFFKSI
jgi:hypothetical protein